MEFDWTTEYGKIIEFLLDCLENEHLGESGRIWQEIVEKWKIKNEIF